MTPCKLPPQRIHYARTARRRAGGRRAGCLRRSQQGGQLGGGERRVIVSGHEPPASPDRREARRPGGTPTPAASTISNPEEGVMYDKTADPAHCMRSHKVTGFPDPVTGSNNGVGWLLPGDIDVTSPAFQRAAQACKHFVGGNFETSHAPPGHPNKAGP